MNLAKGILETRVVTYKHLKTLLRPIPLDTPTTIELSPGNEIRVTLFDANHCPGAVGFLIEGQGKAVMYTGDIRSEPWWVNALARQPYLVPYTTGIKTLDNIYLDTTFATKSNPFREFPTKQDGLCELLADIAKYPSTTVFHFNSWTFGYEDVWVALSVFLNTQMHMDPYKLRLFGSFSNPKGGHAIALAPALIGFQLGNALHEGCLTNDASVRLHGCEAGHGCSIKSKANTVRIVPIIKRLQTGEEMLEVGAGGGHGDLAQWHELDLSDQNAATSLLSLCAAIKDDSERKRAVNLVMEGIESKNRKLKLPENDELDEDEDITLQTLTSLLGQDAQSTARPSSHKSEATSPNKDLPREIHFPYSRHSSYDELRHLVSTFKPRDLYPCTVHDLEWNPSLTMKELFGDLCSADIYAHDKAMLEWYWERMDQQAEREEEQTQSSERNESSQAESIAHQRTESQAQAVDARGSAPAGSQITAEKICSVDSAQQHQRSNTRPSSQPHESRKRKRASQDDQARTSSKFSQVSGVAGSSPQIFYTPAENGSASTRPSQSRSAAKDQTAFVDAAEIEVEPETEPEDANCDLSQHTLSDSAFASQDSIMSETTRQRKLARRRDAYDAAKGRNGFDWHQYSTITPVDDRDLG